jgi:hypothetical protein
MDIRKTVLAVSLVSSSLSAVAEDMFFTANNDNGVIVVTDQACKKQGYITKSTEGASGLVTLWGCAMPVSDTLWKILWNNGMEVYADIGVWRVTNALYDRVNKATKGRMASDLHHKK